MNVKSPAGVVPDSRVLVVSDWSTDPAGVITACRERTAGGEVAFALVVPAWLHGLDWVGDPTASQPCAGRQLATLTRLAASAGLDAGIAARVAIAATGAPYSTAVTASPSRHARSNTAVAATGCGAAKYETTVRRR